MKDIARLLLIFAGTFLKINAARLKFPADFKIGVATAAYQIEGGWNESGKGVNIWDHLVHNYPELIKDNSNADVTCDSYHLWKRDIEMLEELNVDFYRFSLSWSRILPDGFPHRINPDGVRYYNNIIDTLLEKNIEPMVTIYHWDLPQYLQNTGGLLNEQVAVYMENYAEVAFRLFGDRVKLWVTINEPTTICIYAYERDTLAPPFSKMPGIGPYLCGRTILLAHARIYHMYDKNFRKTQQGKIGLTVNTEWREPKSNSPSDRDAAERALQMDFAWWIHPIYSKHGDYPEIMKERIGNISLLENYAQSRLEPFTKKEVRFIQGTFDFLGLNHYATLLVSNHDYPIDYPTSHVKDMGIKQSHDENWKISPANWVNVVPWGFRKLLNWIKTEYDNPLVYVTESGYADYGELNDTERIQYHEKYLHALLEAIHDDGCNVKAYTVWSLMDNWEWRSGYVYRFGLYSVDFNNPNRTRTKKASADFYKKVIKTRYLPNSDFC